MSFLIIGLIVIVGFIAALLLADTCARRFTDTYEDLDNPDRCLPPFDRSED